MDKYYVVIMGEYSDKRIIGITKDKEAAEKTCAFLNKNYDGNIVAHIKAFEDMNIKIDEIPKKIYIITMNQEGEIKEKYVSLNPDFCTWLGDNSYEREDFLKNFSLTKKFGIKAENDCIDFYIIPTNDKEVEKIAFDRYAKYKYYLEVEGIDLLDMENS